MYEKDAFDRQCRRTHQDLLEGNQNTKFCEKCGSYMRETPAGFVCSKCGNQVKAEIVDVVRIEPRPSSAVVDVLDSSKLEYNKISAVCPRCDNREAFHSLGLVSGEHAGVRQERSMQRYTCTKCGHSWSVE